MEISIEGRSAAIERLTAERRANPGGPSTVPRKLSLRAIHAEPRVFQVREDGEDPSRVAEIAKGVDGGTLDDPIHIWWSGVRWIVIEGHHRRAGYEKREELTGETLMVPVQAHPAISIWEAMGAAGRMNDREKVQITGAEKRGAAWRMVCCGEGSIAEQAKWSGVAHGTVTNMRKVKAKLNERGVSIGKMIDAGWDQARAWADGKPSKEFNPEAAEAMAQEWAVKIGRALEGRAVMSPDVLARALEIMSPDLPDRLIEAEPFWDALDGTGRGMLEERRQEEEGEGAVEDF